MKGAVFLGDRKVELRDFPEPKPRQGEVVLAVRASGLCGSDLHYYRAPSGTTRTSGNRIAGHEPAGVVHTVGLGVLPEVAAAGDRVMVHHYSGCGRCDSCRSGWSQMCVRGATVFGSHEHGGHAPFMRVPAATLVPLDESLSFAAGAAISCGTGTAWGALERLGDLGGSTIAVFGQGPVGLSATLLANARGARVIVIDPVPSRREHAIRFGATEVIDPVTDQLSERLADLTDGAGVPLLLETSGASAAAAEGLAALAPWGRACFVGLGGEVRFAVRDLQKRQATLMTSWSMSIVQQRQCAEFITRHKLPIDDLFSHTWALEQVVEGYEEFDQQRAGKGVVVFDEPAG